MGLKNRLQKLCQSLVEKEIEAIFISQPENRYYLSGFDGSAGFLLINEKNSILATDFRYVEQAKRQAPDFEIVPISGDIDSWFPGLVSDLELKKLGFEAGHVSFVTYRRLSDILDKVRSRLKLIPTDGLVETLRAIKEADEIEFISKAAEIVDAAFDYIEGMIHTGMSEQEVAWAIEKYMREKGSQTMPFDIIVAAGENSALPHAKPSQRTIGLGEPIVIDIGARIGGYCSDLSRTICLGGTDDTFNKVYDIVLGAQLVALAMTEEGIKGEEADSLARTIIEEAGYGEAFGHGLGHGVGLAPHEKPLLSPKSSEPLVSGMVFTIEPGIYLTDWGGVRIEDLVVMEGSKARVISKARKV